jgi:hypothetical protein
MLTKSDAIRPASLMSALIENERIRSVRGGLVEGICGLRLYLEKPTKPELVVESERCLRILRDFCRYFVFSVEMEKAIAEGKGKAFPKLETIVKDLPLYTGIVSTLKNEERTKDYSTIKEIHESLTLALESKAPVKESDKYLKTLERLYKLIEERTATEQQTAERMILGHDGNF